MNSDERDGLLMRYLDARATPAELRSLNALLKVDADARAELAEISLQAMSMADLAREQAMASPERREVLAQEGRPRRRHWWALASTACLCAMVLAAYAFWRDQLEPFVLAEVSGAVTWIDQAGRAHNDVKPGDKLCGGTLQAKGTTSFAKLLFHDGSTVTLGGESEMTIAAGPQKILLVRSGDLRAEVSPQPFEQPMLVRTPTAEVEVLGTRFSMAVDPQETKLTVAQGRVQMRRLADGSTTEVPAEQSAIATLRTTEALKSERRQPPAARWQQTFEQPPTKTWKGEWMAADAAGPSRMQAVPEVYDRSEHGGSGIAYVVKVEDTCPHVAAVEPDSVLSIRWRTAKPANLMVLVGLHSPACDFRGNFQADFQAGQITPDATGWCRVKLPLSGLRAGFSEFPKPLPDSRVSLVLIASHAPEPGLDVAEVAIEPPPTP
jgi:ferric-dicitrate binding protein FerR (iron transport regulator)